MQVLNIEPHNPLALAYVGIVYQMTGRFGEAIQKYHEVRVLTMYCFPLMAEIRTQVTIITTKQQLCQ